MAATSAVLSVLRPGDHVLAGDDLYGGTYRIFERVLRPMGIAFELRRRARHQPPTPPRSAPRRS